MDEALEKYKKLKQKGKVYKNEEKEETYFKCIAYYEFDVFHDAKCCICII